MAERAIVLLRGVNVGGKNRLAMKDFADVCLTAGCEEVMTYIQSGNAVLTAKHDQSLRLRKDIADLIAERHGIRTSVVMRTAHELAEVLANNPFLAAGVSEETLHVLFLADWPDAARVSALDPARSLPDAFAVRGREVYLHCPNGMARTRLTVDYFDTALRTTGTIRNWRTVTKLHALL